MKDPGEYLMLDFSKFDRPPQLHVGMAAVNAFEVSVHTGVGGGCILEILEVECFHVRVVDFARGLSEGSFTPLAGLHTSRENWIAQMNLRH